MKMTTVHVPLTTGSENPTPGSHHEVITFQFENFSKYADVEHRVFTRHGGISEPPYHTLNAGFDEGDKQENVNENHRIIMAVMGTTRLVFMNQFHGKHITVLRRDSFRGSNGALDGDAVITDITDRTLMVKQADCQAVILLDPVKRVIANIHCGWRGNTEGIIGSVVRRMSLEFACRASDLVAAVGPSLGPCCAEFVTHGQIFPKTFDRFMVRKNYFDLWELSRWQLLEAGLKKKNIEIAAICTRCRTDLFYSYRGEGTTGRFATVVMLK